MKRTAATVAVAAACLVLCCLALPARAASKQALLQYYQSSLALIESPDYAKLAVGNSQELQDKANALAKAAGFADAGEAEVAGDQMGSDPEVAAARERIKKAMDQQLGTSVQE